MGPGQHPARRAHLRRSTASGRIDYLNTRERLYCFDGFAGWDPKYRIKVRVICSRPYHALFMHTMLIRPDAGGTGELRRARLRDLQRRRIPRQPPHHRHDARKTSIDLSLEDGEFVILGTEYAGEMKKGVFTLHELPRCRSAACCRCTARRPRTRRPERRRSCSASSGTGKTTLSADPKRQLIGDDEHCWSDDGIFNIEGGCYAKAINLSPESEPDIFQALRFGAVLENVVLDEDHARRFHATRASRRTPAARIPIEFIRNAKIPCVAGHPTDVIFLTCDAFGVLPPVSTLTPAQAMYHFISGYTAKVAGTEMGVTEPQATFSPLTSANRCRSPEPWSSGPIVGDPYFEVITHMPSTRRVGRRRARGTGRCRCVRARRRGSLAASRRRPRSPAPNRRGGTSRCRRGSSSPHP